MLGIANRASAAPLLCSFIGGISSGSISFGSIDPSSASTFFGTVTQQISFSCNKNTVPYTIAVNPASGWALASGANSLSYTLGVTPGGSTGIAGSAVNLLIAPPSGGASSIIAADFQNAVAGAYANTSAITVTVSYGGATPLTASIPIGSVTGTVVNTCSVFQAAGTLTFNIDPSVIGTTNGTISGDMQIKCTRNDSVTITATSKCGALDDAYPSCGGYKIPYAFNFLSSTIGQGFGAAIPLNIGGSVNSVNYQNAPVGAGYGDLQTLTISY